MKLLSGTLIACLAFAAGCTRVPETADEARRTTEERARATAVTAEDIAAARAAYAPEEGDWLITRMPAEPGHLNPFTGSDAYASRINAFIFDTLLHRDYETLEFQPHIAESWEISDDHLVYTFRLRDDVRFSDGEPLTVEDVKFSFDLIKDPTIDAPHLRNYYQDVVSCEIVDPVTVRFTCERPYFRHLTMLSGLPIIPKHIYGEGDFNQHPNNRRPVGSGPYVFSEWRTGQQIVLDRNRNYWNPERQGYIDRRLYKVITNDNAALMDLMRGGMDTMGLTPEQWRGRANTAQFNERFNKYDYYTPFYSYIGWNARRATFEDARVRQALTMLVDRDTILETLYYGLGVPVTGPLFVDSDEYNADVAPWPYDPQAAAALLAEAGWTDRNREGVLVKDGVPLAFELLITNDNPIAEKIATAFQDELRKIGIRLSIRPLEWATFLESVDGHNFDSVMLGWSMPPDSDPYQVWHSSQIESGSNYVAFANSEVDALLEEARVTFDRDERIELYRRFHEIVHEEQPYTFLFCSKALLAVDKRVHGIIMYPYGPQAIEWYVPKTLQSYP